MFPNRHLNYFSYWDSWRKDSPDFSSADRFAFPCQPCFPTCSGHCETVRFGFAVGGPWRTRRSIWSMPRFRWAGWAVARFSFQMLSHLKGTDGPGNLKVSCMSRSHCSRHNWPLQVQHSFRVSVPARYSQAVGLRRLRTELEPEAWWQRWTMVTVGHRVSQGHKCHKTCQLCEPQPQHQTSSASGIHKETACAHHGGDCIGLV